MLVNIVFNNKVCACDMPLHKSIHLGCLKTPMLKLYASLGKFYKLNVWIVPVALYSS